MFPTASTAIIFIKLPVDSTAGSLISQLVSVSAWTALAILVHSKYSPLPDAVSFPWIVQPVSALPLIVGAALPVSVTLYQIALVPAPERSLHFP